MKVQLIVVQGRPEGKVIPLSSPQFKIGRGETCHLRPNSEQVSREHAEFTLTAEGLAVRDLGSRNGTLVNGKAVRKDEAFPLKDRDLVQVGPLTFAVSIEGAPLAASGAASGAKPSPSQPGAAARVKATPEDVDNEDIESWLVADAQKAGPPERPSGVYSGDTITVTAFRDGPAAGPAPAAVAVPVPVAAPAAVAAPVRVPVAAPAPIPTPAPSPVSSSASTPVPAPAAPSPTPPIAPKLADGINPLFDSFDGAGLVNAEAETDEMDAESSADPSEDGDGADEDEGDGEGEEAIDDFIDESNPFYAAKKKAEDGPTKAVFADTSDAARDILRRLMERRRQSRL
jgi:predicted component of type VI protein secretion system